MRIRDWSADVCSSDLMRGVGNQGHMYVDAVECAVGRRAQMIFNVAWSAHIFRIGGAAGKFVENDAKAFGEHIGKDVQTAAMGHAIDDFAHAIMRTIFDDAFQRRNHGFAAIQPEPLGARSEEHTSELQSLMRISYAVFCLKKKTQK